MLKTFFVMLVIFSMFKIGYQHLKLVPNILNRSSTAETCHRHIWSQTSVTNIDVTINLSKKYLSTTRKMTYEKLLQKVAVNLFDVPKFQKSQFSKDFLLLNPALLLHLLLPMRRNCLACLVACHSIEFSRMKTDEVQV